MSPFPIQIIIRLIIFQHCLIAIGEIGRHYNHVIKKSACWCKLIRYIHAVDMHGLPGIKLPCMHAETST